MLFLSVCHGKARSMPTHVTNPDAEVRRAQNPGKDETVLTHEIDYPFAYASAHTRGGPGTQSGNHGNHGNLEDLTFPAAILDRPE